MYHYQLLTPSEMREKEAEVRQFEKRREENKVQEVKDLAQRQSLSFLEATALMVAKKG